MLALAAAIAAFTGSPVTLDARLDPPPCLTPPVIGWAPPRSAVSVTCASPGWRLFVPVVAAAPAAAALPLVRRGDIIAVVAGGPGFRVTVDAVAEADAVAGARLRLRNRATGEQIVAMVTDSGEIVLPGFKQPEGGR